MRHLTAVHLDPSDTRPGGWHYASLGSRGGGPIGFCAHHVPHDTETEARQCFTEYRRSRVRMFKEYNNWGSCAICDAPTKLGIECGAYRMARLCTLHHNLDRAYGALSLNEPATDSWES